VVKQRKQNLTGQFTVYFYNTINILPCFRDFKKLKLNLVYIVGCFLHISFRKGRICRYGVCIDELLGGNFYVISAAECTLVHMTKTHIRYVLQKELFLSRSTLWRLGNLFQLG
jgi:hypothetical protein